MLRYFSPLWFGAETAYTLVVVFLCIYVFCKTKEMYDLTRHRGIRYFRNAFLFFGLAYSARLAFHMIQLGIASSGKFVPGRITFPLAFTLVGYLSTMAIFCLAYSTAWKKVWYTQFLIGANAIAIGIAAVSYITRSPMVVGLVQLPLIVFTLISSNRGKKSHARALYFLISLFWLVNLFVLGPRKMLPLEIKAALQLISLGVFAVLSYRVAKWAR
ncbi:MAG: hypothetical protein ABH879_06755 [archaeon]